MEELADEGLRGYVAEVRAAPGPSVRDLGAAGLRDAAAGRVAIRPPGPELAAVTDLLVDAVPVRLYRPSLHPRPLVVFLHGGGWTIGDLDTHDRLCRLMAELADVAVLAVDYRRAPEHPWPAAVEDAVTAYLWARSEGLAMVGGHAVAVAGDSAGGNLAALCCLGLRDVGEPQPDLQVLAYPNTDLTLSCPSVREKATGWGLDADAAVWFAEQWVPDVALRSDPRVSPLLEPDLSGLAPALVVTAEHDVLRDEGDAYAEALAAAGVPVTHRCEPGLVHGFLGLDQFSDACRDASHRLFADVARLLA